MEQVSPLTSLVTSNYTKEEEEWWGWGERERRKEEGGEEERSRGEGKRGESKEKHKSQSPEPLDAESGGWMRAIRGSDSGRSLPCVPCHSGGTENGLGAEQRRSVEQHRRQSGQ